MKSMKTIVPTAIIEKTCKELYKAGMNVYQVANLLSLKSDEARSYIGCGSKSYPDTDLDMSLIDQILYDADIPIATESVIRIEKDRYRYYADIEAKSLSVMLKLLTYYESLPEGDMKIDAFKAQLASSFVKATQQARDELLKKYAIDRGKTIADDTTIKIEFVGES